MFQRKPHRPHDIGPVDISSIVRLGFRAGVRRKTANGDGDTIRWLTTTEFPGRPRKRSFRQRRRAKRTDMSLKICRKRNHDAREFSKKPPLRASEGVAHVGRRDGGPNTIAPRDQNITHAKCRNFVLVFNFLILSKNCIILFVFSCCSKYTLRVVAELRSQNPSGGPTLGSKHAKQNYPSRAHDQCTDISMDK